MNPIVMPLPSHGEVFVDARGDERWLRVSWHHDNGLVILSLWREGRCSGTLALPRDDVPGLITALVNGLAEGPHGSGSRDERAEGDIHR